MALRELHHQALELRKRGLSYSQIKQEIGVSKSTLSGWLGNYPLSEERIRELRDNNQQRIERIRETKAAKRLARIDKVQKVVSGQLGRLSEREILIAGLFLYWGEGSKTTYYSTSLSNTDPDMLKFFLGWLEVLNIPKEKIKIRLNLYLDMNIEEELVYWSETLGVPKIQFRNSYIKKSKRKGITYFQRFTHGTVNIIIENRDLYEYMAAALQHIRNTFADRPAA